MKILLTLFILILAFQFSFGQDNPKAEKIEDFGATNCCEFANKMDYLLSEIFVNKSDSIGYVVIYSSNQDVLQGLYTENKILGHLKFRLDKTIFQQSVANADTAQNKIFIVRKNTEGKFKIEFWKVEKGANLPFTTFDEWNLSSIKYQKPTLYFTTFNEGECSFDNGIKQFSGILSANPNLRGNIAIFEKTQKDFLKTKKELLSDIPNDLNILKNQVRTFFIKTSKHSYPRYELWFVPKKKLN